MRKPTREQINACKIRLRRKIDNSRDPAIRRLAQAMETALIWGTDSTDWRAPDSEVNELAKWLKEELQ
jgi:hypothetical protein